MVGDPHENAFTLTQTGIVGILAAVPGVKK